LCHIIWSRDFKKINNSQELSFGNMTAFGLIIVLEDWFQIKAPYVNGSLVFSENLSEVILISIS
jgi:hypothetical protein